VQEGVAAEAFASNLFFERLVELLGDEAPVAGLRGPAVEPKWPSRNSVQRSGWGFSIPAQAR
jgi:hypothetical protein